MLVRNHRYHVVKVCNELDVNLKEFLNLNTNFFVFSKHNSNKDADVHFHIYFELKEGLSLSKIQEIFDVERWCVEIVHCSRKDIIEYLS